MRYFLEWLVVVMSELSYVHTATNVSWMYGIFVILGGVVGYVQAGSQISLYAGTAAGGIALLSSRLCKKGYYNMGLKILTAVSLGLSILFIKRYQATGVILPTGFMAINSAFVLFLSLMAQTQLASSARKTE